MPAEPPRSEDELFRRADRFAGRTLAWLAQQEGVEVPPDQRRNKGWIGLLLERALGATAGSAALPDFPDIGIELKSLPLDARGKPRESTFVCTAPVNGTLAPSWEQSWVRKKLSRVLWVPVVGDKTVPLGNRIIGAPLMWTPDAEEAGLLAQDWEDLTEYIVRGEFWLIDARQGKVLQLRPKAANASQATWALDEEGEWVQVNPMGFYLRARFTAQMIAKRFRLPG